jgi:hypothetical protein
MVYRTLGNTGIQASILGFGCMRLPMTTQNGTERVDDALATPLLHRAVDLGVNFFDAHWFYCNYDSQRAIGEALRNVRDKIYLSTKLAMWLVEKPEDFDDYLNRALEQLGVEYLDFYHFPHLSYRRWKEQILPLKLLDRAEKAKAKGLIRHMSFSFHSDPQKMHELIDTGAFATVMGQYNLVDYSNEPVFSYAKSRDMGTIVMVPLMGGILTQGGQTFVNKMKSQAASAAEMALRFVYASPNVDVVLSGMSTLAQLEENAEIAKKAGEILPAEREALIFRAHTLHGLNDLLCNNCNYCHECPKGIKIGQVFKLYLHHTIWGLGESIRAQRGNGTPFGFENDPASCDGCGACVTRCPQNIDIPKKLKHVWQELLAL